MFENLDVGKILPAVGESLIDSGKNVVRTAGNAAMNIIPKPARDLSNAVAEHLVGKVSPAAGERLGELNNFMDLSKLPVSEQVKIIGDGFLTMATTPTVKGAMNIAKGVRAGLRTTNFAKDLIRGGRAFVKGEAKDFGNFMIGGLEKINQATGKAVSKAASKAATAANAKVASIGEKLLAKQTSKTASRAELNNMAKDALSTLLKPSPSEQRAIGRLRDPAYVMEHITNLPQDLRDIRRGLVSASPALGVISGRTGVAYDRRNPGSVKGVFDAVRRKVKRR